jgi:hypothetical protein
MEVKRHAPVLAVREGLRCQDSALKMHDLVSSSIQAGTIGLGQALS